MAFTPTLPFRSGRRFGGFQQGMAALRYQLRQAGNGAFGVRFPFYQSYSLLATLEGAEGASPSDEGEGLSSGFPGGDGYHIPVLPAEVIHYLQPGPGKLFLDGTLGGGGHSELLLEAGAEVIALDQDAEALAHARQRLQRFGDRFRAFQSNFRHFPDVLRQLGVTAVDGLFSDIGVSSHQLDEAQRGFSFQRNGPLDMRMNASEGQTAADWVNTSSQEELERIFRDYGEERSFRRIARALVQQREERPFATTADLAEGVCRVIPRHGKTHPATLVFQALRIAVNDELGALEDFLAQAPAWLKPGGRVAVISFHSLEDRMVKRAFLNYATEWHDRPEWPAPRRNPDYCLRLLTKKPLEAAAEEARRNPRARSARLRVAEKLP